MNVRRLGAVAALALLALPAAAQDEGDRSGLFLQASGGRADYDYDCVLPIACREARAQVARLGIGWRWDVFGVEAAFTDFGRSDISPPGETLRLRSVGVNAVWHLRLGSVAEGYLRAGYADVRQDRRIDGRSSRASPTFGVGIAAWVAPTVALQLGLDHARGDRRGWGSVGVSALTAGIRLQL